MLSLGGERLNPPPTKKKKKKVLDHYLHHELGMPPLLCLLILEYPDHHQNLISSSLYYPGPLHKISSQSVHNFLSNIVHRQTNKQNRQTKRYQKHNLLCQGGNYHKLNVGPWWTANSKASESLSAPCSGHATTIIVFFAWLLISEDPDRHQN